MNKVYENHKSSIGDLEANIVSLLIYITIIVVELFNPGGQNSILSLISFLIPIAVYFIEKKSMLVKFHAIQLAFLNVLVWIFGLVMQLILGILITIAKTSGDLAMVEGNLTILGYIVLAVAMALLIYKFILMIKAYQWTAYHLPLVGKFADKYIDQ